MISPVPTWPMYHHSVSDAATVKTLVTLISYPSCLAYIITSSTYTDVTNSMTNSGENDYVTRRTIRRVHGCQWNSLVNAPIACFNQ